jgi:hypothetical protein
MTAPAELVVLIRCHAPDAVVVDGDTVAIGLDRLLTTPERLRRLQALAAAARRTVQAQVRVALGLDDPPAGSR